MTGFSSMAPYHVLIVDDAVENISDFGPSTRDLLNGLGCITILVTSVKEAIAVLKTAYFDVLVIDINLGYGKETDGFLLQQSIRELGQVQPIIMATGQPDELKRPIKDYVDVFASGATFFYEKRKGKFVDLFSEAVRHIDPIRRALYLMKNNGYSDQPLVFGAESYTIEDLLVNNGKNEDVLRQLRDAFYELFLEMWKNGDSVAI